MAAMKSLHKAKALVRDLKDLIAMRLPTSTITEGADSEGYPTLLISQSAVAVVGEDNLLLRIRTKADDIARTDALGLDARMYAPHTAQLLQQKNATTAVTTTAATLAKVLDLVSKLGTRVELYTQADATNAVVAVAQIIAANKTADLAALPYKSIQEV